MRLREAIFLWSWRNVHHIGEHGVTPAEAEHVVRHARAPYPQARSHAKWMVHGQTTEGRLLQVVFVRARLNDVEPEEFERLAHFERAALQDDEPAVRIIHARDLTEIEKRRFRRRRRS
jgi:uncharacterized DUF497 family protein